jgi:FAD binding domain
MVDRMRSGRVLVAGDAAHVHSPMGGQGIASAIQDAMNLAWKLSRAIRGAPERLLDSYGAERLPKIHAVLEETDRNAQIFLAPNVALRLLRDFPVLPLMRSSLVQRGMFNRLSQIYVSYRGSPREPGGIRANGRGPRNRQLRHKFEPHGCLDWGARRPLRAGRSVAFLPMRAGALPAPAALCGRFLP